MSLMSWLVCAPDRHSRSVRRAAAGFGGWVGEAVAPLGPAGDRRDGRRGLGAGGGSAGPVLFVESRLDALAPVKVTNERQGEGEPVVLLHGALSARASSSAWCSATRRPTVVNIPGPAAWTRRGTGTRPPPRTPTGNHRAFSAPDLFSGFIAHRLLLVTTFGDIKSISRQS